MRRTCTVLVAAWLQLTIAAASEPLARYPAQPAVGAGVLCVSDSGVYCLDQRNLEHAWQALEGIHTLEPVIAAGRLLVGSSNGVHALDAVSGRRLWHRRGTGLVFTPTVDQRTAYTGDEHGRMEALEIETGALRWHRHFDGWSYPPAIVGDVLITGGRDGVVRGLDPATGDTQWRIDLDEELVYRPVAADDHALITTFGRTVAAITKTGEIAWRRHVPSPSFSPATAGNIAVFGGMDSRFRALSVRTGDRLWQHTMGGTLSIPPRAEGARVGVVDGDGRVRVLSLANGRCRAGGRLPGKPLASPVRLPGNRWIALYREGGTIHHLTLSHESGCGSLHPVSGP